MILLMLTLRCVLQSGETALHVAARYGNVDVVSYLCSIRANPDLPDRVRTHTFTYRTNTLPFFNQRTKSFYYFVFPSPGAGDPAALCRVARILASSQSALPGRLPRGRQEQRGGESAADGIRSRLCGHCGVPGGAQG